MKITINHERIEEIIRKAILEEIHRELAADEQASLYFYLRRTDGFYINIREPRRLKCEIEIWKPGERND